MVHRYRVLKVAAYHHRRCTSLSSKPLASIQLARSTSMAALAYKPTSCLEREKWLFSVVCVAYPRKITIFLASLELCMADYERALSCSTTTDQCGRALQRCRWDERYWQCRRERGTTRQAGQKWSYSVAFGSHLQKITIFSVMRSSKRPKAAALRSTPTRTVLEGGTDNVIEFRFSAALADALGKGKGANS